MQVVHGLHKMFAKLIKRQNIRGFFCLGSGHYPAAGKLKKLVEEMRCRPAGSSHLIHIADNDLQIRRSVDIALERW